MNESHSKSGKGGCFSIAAAGILMICGLITWSIFTRETPPVPGPPVDQSIVLDELPSPEEIVAWSAPETSYVGSQACSTCHEDRVHDFHETAHFNTSRLPDIESQGEYFGDEDSLYQSRVEGFEFDMRVEGRQLVVDARIGDQTESFSVDMIFGAGGADEVYHHWRDDELFELPVAFVHPLDAWTNAPGFLDGDLRLDRPVVPRCLECHTTSAAYRPGSTNSYDRSSVILGVSCERCHGPARDHVEFHAENPDAIESHGLVNPSDLSRALQMDVCGQCHSNTTKRRTAPFSFRPGDKLATHFRTDLNDRPEYDHTANHVRYLTESRCYNESKTMTCTTCHDPHSKEDKSTVAANVRSCLQCHESENCGERESLDAGVRDRCIDCHMPARLSMSVTFDTATEDAKPVLRRHSHRIGIDREARDRTVLNWLREHPESDTGDQTAKLAESLVESHRTRAKAFEEEHRLLAAMGEYRELLEIQPGKRDESRLKDLGRRYREQRLILREAMTLSDQQAFPDARRLLIRLLSLNPQNAIARGKLGAIEAASGDMESAVKELELAASQDPDDPYAASMLGWLHYLQKDFDSAEKFYQQALEIDPWNAKLLYQAALNSFDTGKFEECIQRLEKSLSIRPHQSDCLHVLALSFQKMEKLERAIEVEREAVAMTRKENPVMLRTLAELYAADGKPDAALEIINQAITVARDSFPDLVEDLKSDKAIYDVQSSQVE